MKTAKYLKKSFLELLDYKLTEQDKMYILSVIIGEIDEDTYLKSSSCNEFKRKYKSEYGWEYDSFFIECNWEKDVQQEFQKHLWTKLINECSIELLEEEIKQLEISGGAIYDCVNVIYDDKLKQNRYFRCWRAFYYCDDNDEEELMDYYYGNCKNSDDYYFVDEVFPKIKNVNKIVYE